MQYTPDQLASTANSSSSERKKTNAAVQLIFKDMTNHTKVGTDRLDQFDPDDFKKDATRAGGLSEAVKVILKAEPEKRTADDVKAVNVCRAELA